MNKEKESVKRLEIGKDYITVLYSKFIVIDRVGNFDNKGFYEDLYKKDIPCTNYESWREATEEEVIEAFKRHLIHRYGEDWETMKIKKRHPSSSLWINNGSWEVEIVKEKEGWEVWNKNGLLYCNGIWVERLEEEEIMKKYRLKQWYPSLQKKTIEGNIANWDDDEKAYTVIQNGDRVEILDKTEVENNPDFWELIEEEKPLFITDDGWRFMILTLWFLL